MRTDEVQGRYGYLKRQILPTDLADNESIQEVVVEKEESKNENEYSSQHLIDNESIYSDVHNGSFASKNSNTVS
jgi:hypothetical protein